MIEKGIKGRICHAMHRYAKANNKYMKDYNKDEKESFLEYLCQNHYLLMVLIRLKICLK